MAEDKPDSGAVANLRAELGGEQVKFLTESKGWNIGEATDYVMLYQTWYPNLTPEQRARASAYERKYGAGPDFVILKKMAS